MNFKKIAALAFVALTAIGTQAQTPEEIAQIAAAMPQLPIDPAVRKGVLPNGMTYYIRHNAWPEDRAFFYIAQNTGSMQEEDDQRGLAHFLEHMCFNGTTHFPGDKLKQYLESIGVKFGENLNAYTSFDEIVYNIDNVKTDRESALDSCLLILHDWSSDLLLEGREIDKERGVINEEWRMRSSAMQRMQEKMLPEIYPGTKYAHRMPIGTMDVVMNFKHDALRQYYHRWFRTDLQAIVVVGDIDVDKMEEKVKALFSPIKAVENPPKREFYPVPDNQEPLVSIQKDKEQTRSLVQLMIKHDIFPQALRNTQLYYMQELLKGAISSMFSGRIQEIMMKENPPFMGASLYDGEFFASKTKDALTGGVVIKGDAYEEGFSALYREMLRAARHGFTVSEYERFKQDYLSSLEDAYKQKDKVESSSYVNECVRNYLDGTPMPGIETTYPLMKALVEQIPLQAVNMTLQQLVQSDSNVVIIALCPEKEGLALPTKEQLLGVMKQVEAETIEPYAEEVSSDPLISETLKGSKVKSEKAGAFGSTVLTLANGIKIHIKKTDFAPNQISMRATSWGGTSLYPEGDKNASNASLVSLGGLGNFSAVDLQKKLSGKKVSVDADVSTRTESISGSCVKKDFETMMQVTYLTFTSPRRDDAAYNSALTRMREQLKNVDLNPLTALQDTITKVLYDNHVSMLRTKVEDLDKYDYTRMLEIYKERFANAADFEFFFVGDIDIDSVRPLLEKYLGSLPVSKSRENYKNVTFRLADGQRKNVFEKKQETPNSITLFVNHAHVKEDLKTLLTVSMLEQLMSMRYTETVREDEGGAYSVGVQGEVEDYPENVASILVQLPTAPDKRDRMAEVVYKGMDAMCDEGPKAEDLQKVKEYLHRSFQENVKDNGFWLNKMVELARYNKNYYDDYEKTVDAITAADIQQMARTIFRSGNRIEVGITSPKEQ